MRWLSLLLVIPLTTSFFTDDFAQFIEENYGTTFLDLLQRKDLGDKGSFGGKVDADDEVVNDPIIFVHGISDTAGEKMKNIAQNFVEMGYAEGELYATTYSNGPKGNPLAWTQYSMRCEYVKQIRALILAVKYYTGKDVDVVAYSLGVPIARKAVLGGFCVDTDEELGSPLTKYVDTFVGIAGPNHGIALKIIGVPVPACVLGAPPICDRITGLYSGLCPLESMFLNDINRKEHYEGKHVYSIYSQSDHLIGYRVCDKVTASIPGEDGHKVFPNFDHDDILPNSVDMLATVIQNHTTFIQNHKLLNGTRTFNSTARKNKKKAAPRETKPVTSLIPLTTVSGPHIKFDDLKALESIFTDTKPSSIQNIRNFFRQKFADEEGEDAANREQKVSVKQAKIASPEDDASDDHEQKNSHETDWINDHLEQKKGQARETIPFMKSQQVQGGKGYHTLIRLQLNRP